MTRWFNFRIGEFKNMELVGHVTNRSPFHHERTLTISLLSSMCANYSADLITVNRSEALERALSTVVSNGLRAGWLDLGHSDGEVMSLIRQLPGGPLAFRGGEPGNAADLEVGGASPSTVTEATEPRIVAAVVSNDTLPTAPSAPASE